MPPACRIRPTTSSPLPASRLPMTTMAPALAIARAVARPMPVPPPVTTPILPVRFAMIFSHLWLLFTARIGNGRPVAVLGLAGAAPFGVGPAPTTGVPPSLHPSRPLGSQREPWRSHRHDAPPCDVAGVLGH